VKNAIKELWYVVCEAARQGDLRVLLKAWYEVVAGRVKVG